MNQWERFCKAFEELIGVEQGYVNDPDDPGGETKWGITKMTYPDLDIKNLSLEDAKKIYYLDFWKKIWLDAIPHYAIQYELFDTAVNTSPHEAIEIAQRSVNYLGESLAEDGIMGPNTLAAIIKWIRKDVKSLFKVLNGFQFIHYVEVIKNRPKSKKYARGWMKRIQDYKETKNGF